MSAKAEQSGGSLRWRMICGPEGAEPSSGGGAPRSPELDAAQRRLDHSLNAAFPSFDTPGAQMIGGGRNPVEGAGFAPRARLNLKALRADVKQVRGRYERLFGKDMVAELKKEPALAHGWPSILERLDDQALAAATAADPHMLQELVTMSPTLDPATRRRVSAIVGRIVREMMRRMRPRYKEAFRDRSHRPRRTRRPRPPEIDWLATIAANLHRYEPERRTMTPERWRGRSRRRRRSDLDEVIICIDKSGSMAPSLIHATVCGAALAAAPALETKLVVFDERVIDLTPLMPKPGGQTDDARLSAIVEAILGAQLGGGTNIDAALAYCAGVAATPARAHLLLVSDLLDGLPLRLIARATALKQSGINLIVALAITEDGAGQHCAQSAAAIRELGAPVFACGPDRLPDVLSAALERRPLA